MAYNRSFKRPAVGDPVMAKALMQIDEEFGKMLALIQTKVTGDGVATISAGTSAPVNPQVGDLWAHGGSMEMWNGSAWVPTDTQYRTDFLSGWAYRRRIDLPATASDLASFPVEVPIVSDPSIGAECRADGFDIRFTAADGQTPLPYERESFVVAGGEATGIFWVRTDVAAAGTHIWCYYGNVDAADGDDHEAVWDADFAAIWHMNDATTSTILDSTGNDNDGAKNGANDPAEADSKIGKGQDFDGDSGAIAIGNPASIQFGAGSFSVSGWVSLASYSGIVEKRSGATGWIFASGPPYTYVLLANVAYAFPGIAADGWHHWTVVINRATSLLDFYVDGAFVQSADISGNTGTTDSLGGLWLGKSIDPTYVDGVMDEIRLSSVARSAAWIAYEYANMAAADGGLTWGAEQNIVFVPEMP
jgi:biopolymer transport protein ExbB